jgi:capsular exopolysaccharide synthesis family protein
MKKNKHRKPTTKQLFSVADENAPFTYVEAYKMLCTNLEFITTAQDCKKIMVTSTLANEGKTNVSVNLALTLAGYDKKVCLIECDLRRPSVHRFLKAKRSDEGLTNVLKGETTLEKSIKKVSGTNMDILLSGSTPPNPSELLASNKMKEVIDKLETLYDYVIYDTPPVLLVTDAAALGKYMDGALLVVKHNSTEKGLALKAKSNLDSAGVKILGAVYSIYSEKSAGSYSKYSSYNYYYYYGGYYGYGYGNERKSKNKDNENNDSEE